jgi:hypothetical protein
VRFVRRPLEQHRLPTLTPTVVAVTKLQHFSIASRIVLHNHRRDFGNANNSTNSCCDLYGYSYKLAERRALVSLNHDNRCSTNCFELCVTECVCRRYFCGESGSTVSGINLSYSVRHYQQDFLDAATGIISFELRQWFTPRQRHRITATTPGGNTFGVSIEVNDIAPLNLNYDSNVFIVNTSVVNLAPTISSFSYSVARFARRTFFEGGYFRNTDIGFICDNLYDHRDQFRREIFHSSFD